MVVGPDEAVDLAVGRCCGVGGALGSGQRPAGVPVAGQSLLIQVDMQGGAKLNHAHSKQALINVSQPGSDRTNPQYILKSYKIIPVKVRQAESVSNIF